MVIDKDLKPLHELTEEGKQAYSDFLEKKADEILFKHQHPFKWLFVQVKEALNRE